MSRPQLYMTRAAALRVFGLVLLVLAIFAFTIACFAALATTLTGVPLLSRWSLIVGTVWALTSAWIVSFFCLRRQTQVLPASHAKDAVDKLQEALEGLGYDVVADGQSRLVGCPSFWSLLLGGAVYGNVAGGRMSITGPRLAVERIRRQLRVNAHLNASDNRAQDRPPVVRRTTLDYAVEDKERAARLVQLLSEVCKDTVEITGQLRMTITCDSDEAMARIRALADTWANGGSTPV